MLGRNVVVQGVDALEDDYLVLFQLQRLRRLQHAHLAGELILRHEDALAAGEFREVFVQKLHIHAQGALKVDGPLLGARGGGGVHGAEVVVHADGVGAHAALRELFLDLLGRGRLAAAGGAGEQDDGALPEVLAIMSAAPRILAA